MLLRSTDSGAPTLTGETGSLYSVLKWALPELGWTLEFDDATNSRAAFRNSPLNGTGDYLRIADNPSDHDGANAKTANVRSYSTMSDVDTGLDEVGDASWLIVKSMTADDTARPWALVGDDTYFVLLIAGGNDDFYTEYYFGDIQSDKPGDSGRFLTQAQSSTDPSGPAIIAPIDSYGSAPNGFSQLRTNSGATLVGDTVQYAEYIVSGETAHASNYPGTEGTYPEPTSGGIRVTDITLLNSSEIRGRLKGMMLICNDVVGVFSNFQVISSQATPRGNKDCTIVNRYARLNSTSFQGVLIFDTDHGEW